MRNCSSTRFWSVMSTRAPVEDRRASVVPLVTSAARLDPADRTVAEHEPVFFGKDLGPAQHSTDRQPYPGLVLRVDYREKQVGAEAFRDFVDTEPVKRGEPRVTDDAAFADIPFPRACHTSKRQGGQHPLVAFVDAPPAGLKLRRRTGDRGIVRRHIQRISHKR